MTQIPRGPLLLGMAGLIPFLWGIITLYSPSAFDLTMSIPGPRFVAPYVMLSYGSIILSFMAGVLWGFATRAPQAAWIYYALSVIPALWVFLLVGAGPISSARYLIAGFVCLLGLDWLFWSQKLTPPWWLSLRILLTGVVVVCLSVVAFG